MQVNSEGRAYGRTKGTSDLSLVQCGPQTSGGELLRRYWQPVALSSEATELPRLLKVLDEELILFRDREGRPGLLYPRCAHRGTSLLYGKVEAQGIRCCYHGWMFDVEGRCVETPCEPHRTNHGSIRQPWYPLIEKFGLVFAYMGPADRQPPFPTFSIEESLAPDEKLVAFLNTSGPNGPHPKIAAKADFNWWQTFDNFMDPFHVVITHYSINGAQFCESLGILPEVRFEYTGDGVRAVQKRRMPDGQMHQRVSQVIMPNMHCTPGVTDEDLGRSGIGWIVPQDDTSFRHFRLFRVSSASNQMSNLQSIGMLQDDWGPQHGKPFSEWSLEDHQRWQTDYVAQKGQGDISLHSEEHLSGIDAGIAMARRMFKKQAEVAAAGGDPVGAGVGSVRRVDILAGNALFTCDGGALVAGYDPLGASAQGR